MSYTGLDLLIVFIFAPIATAYTLAVAIGFLNQFTNHNNGGVKCSAMN